MNLDNRVYGNDYVLALSAGMARRVPPIWGYLQHGWAEHLLENGARHSSRWPVFCYSERQVEATLARHPEVSEVVAIGAPFLYLQHMLEHDGVLRPGAAHGGVVAYPIHHWGTDLTAEHLWEHGLFADLLRDRDDAEQVIVVLHWSDWSSPGVRDIYADRGLAVTTHGRPHEHEMFLFRQLHFLAGRQEYITNALGTSLMFAASLGIPVSVVDFTDASYDGPGRQGQPSLDVNLARNRELFPQLYAGGVSADAALAFGRQELGWEHLRRPAELRELLGWNFPHRVRNHSADGAKAVLVGTRRLLRR